MPYCDSFRHGVEAAHILRQLEEYLSCAASSVNVHVEGLWLPYFARLEFGVEGDPGDVGQIDYGDRVQLWRGPVDPQAALKTLETPDSDPLPVGRARIGWLGPQWGVELPDHRWRDHLWVGPCYYFTSHINFQRMPGENVKDLRDKQKEALQTMPLARPGGPSFEGLHAAVRYWMKLGRRYHRDDSRTWHVEVLVPLCPGKVRLVGSREDCLEVTLVPGRNERELEVQLCWCDDDGEEKWLIGKPEQSVVTFRVVPPEGFRLYVFERGDLIAAYLEGRTDDSSADEETSTPEPADMIRRGESQQVEFKELPQCPPERWGGFWEKLRKPIIAFANTDGGFVLLGVSDAGDIVGADEVMRMLAPEDEDRAKERLVRSIQKHLSENLLNAPEVCMEWASGLDRHVLVVSVPPTGGDVTTDKANHAYVRCNATSRLATPEEIARMMSSEEDRSYGYGYLPTRRGAGLWHPWG